MRIHTLFTNNKVYKNDLLIKVANELSSMKWVSDFEIEITNTYDGIYSRVISGNPQKWEITKVEDVCNEIEKQK